MSVKTLIWTCIWTEQHILVHVITQTKSDKLRVTIFLFYKKEIQNSDESHKISHRWHNKMETFYTYMLFTLTWWQISRSGKWMSPTPCCSGPPLLLHMLPKYLMSPSRHLPAPLTCPQMVFVLIDKPCFAWLLFVCLSAHMFFVLLVFSRLLHVFHLLHNSFPFSLFHSSRSSSGPQAGCSVIGHTEKWCRSCHGISFCQIQDLFYFEH